MANFNISKIVEKLLLPILFLVAFALGIKSFREPDLWWQIRTGEWIIQHFSVPTHDIFSYTFAGTEWINIKWGSEVLFAFFTQLFGVESVYFIQAISNCILLFLLLKIANFYLEKEDSKEVVLFSKSVVIFFFIICAEYRWIGRPEQFTHLFTALFLFILLKQKNGFHKSIYALIPLQILWANMHEAFGIGIVLLLLFLISFLIENIWIKKQFDRTLFLKYFSITFFTSVGIILNPRGYKLFLSPFKIFGQLAENQYTTELLSFTNKLYWNKEAYLGVLVLGILFFSGLYFFSKNKKDFFQKSPFGIFEILVLFAFAFLAAKAYRNIIFLFIAAFPMLLLVVVFFFKKWAVKINFGLRFMFILSIVFYGLVVSNQYYKLIQSRDTFGLEVLSTNNPIGAASFIKKNHLQGKCFSDYLTSSCLLWQLQPTFKTYIDLRDLDVFPASFFQNFMESVTFTENFEKLDSIQHFDYIVLYRLQFDRLHQYLSKNLAYKLVFADAVAAVYTKADSNKNDFQFSDCNSYPSSFFANIINHILFPFYHSFDYAAINNAQLESNFYSNIGNFNKAKLAAEKAIQKSPTDPANYYQLGEINYQLSLQNDSQKIFFQTEASANFQHCISLDENFAKAYVGKGALWMNNGNMDAALQEFEKAISLDKSDLNTYLFAANCAVSLTNQGKDNTDKAIDFYENANNINANNPVILLNLGFLYFRKSDFSKAKEILNKIKNIPDFTEDEKQKIKYCLGKCGA